MLNSIVLINTHNITLHHIAPDKLLYEQENANKKIKKFHPLLCKWDRSEPAGGWESLQKVTHVGTLLRASRELVRDSISRVMSNEFQLEKLYLLLVSSLEWSSRTRLYTGRNNPSTKSYANTYVTCWKKYWNAFKEVKERLIAFWPTSIVIRIWCKTH